MISGFEAIEPLYLFKITFLKTRFPSFSIFSNEHLFYKTAFRK